MESESEPEDDEEKIPNPLNLPLGWDGKPIPLWLFKQYGLGIKYPCEICGNYVYMGRQAFEQHFTVGVVTTIVSFSHTERPCRNGDTHRACAALASPIASNSRKSPLLKMPSSVRLPFFSDGLSSQ